MSAAEVFSINNSISCDLASGFPLFSICCSLFAPVAASVAVRLTDQNIGARVEVPPFLDCDFLECRKQKKKVSFDTLRESQQRFEQPVELNDRR